ncbi:LANO_0G03686g1_1 [Lachancea nothofagi CBS 11611]|uniref:LANO_0G03686g1_1 n=1 Tax=Lachancea nothofagi CBS 11611 TaxID=1266666 RepID=A0A1G4KG30_9SACH|nr:LANO_0G03686g1_1 [Lachancea nothofagi CBS 11611]
MSFNSYQRRGSRSAAQATLANQSFNECEESSLRNITALDDVHVLNNPTTRYENEEVSEDSRLYTNEVKSEEFAILSTSSEREEIRELGSLDGKFAVPSDPSQAPLKSPSKTARSEQVAISNAQRIDDWCVQNDRQVSSLRTPTNKRIQEIVEAWGVENDTPSVAIITPFADFKVPSNHLDNYTAHILDFMSPAQRLRLRNLAESMMPLLKRQLTPRFSSPKFKNIPSVFSNRELQLQCSLQLEMISSLTLGQDSDAGTSRSQSETGSYQMSNSTSGLQSWYGWNIVARFTTDHISGY